MAQMFSSQINLGSVRDIDDSVFVRQASIGNPDLKPSTSSNQNFGLIFQKDSYKISMITGKLITKIELKLKVLKPC